jgi:hypothetical protein
LNPLPTVSLVLNYIVLSSVPVALLFFQRWDTQELVYCGFCVICLQLFRIVVFVLDVNVAGLLFVIVFVLEVIPIVLLVRDLRQLDVNLLLLVGVLHEIVVVRHGCGGEVRR